MRARGFTRLAPLLLALEPACVEGSSLGLAIEEDLLFVLAFDEGTDQLRGALGPYDRDGLSRTAWPATPGTYLALLAVDEARLAELHPSYRPEARAELRVFAGDARLASCGAEGRSADAAHLELALGRALVDTGTARLLRLQPGGAAPAALPAPAELGLRLPVSSCGAGRRIEFVPYARTADLFEGRGSGGLDRIAGLVPLDARSMIARFERGLALLRRGEALDPDRDLIDVGRFELEASETVRWTVRHVAAHAPGWPERPATVLVALAGTDRSTGGLETAGAGWVRLRLAPEGGWSVLDRWTQRPGPELPRVALYFIHLEPSGRSFLVGRGLAGSSSAAEARPALRRISSGFAGKHVVAIDGDAPHLLLLDGGQVFEGDLFEADLGAAPFMLGGSFGLEFNGTARMGDEARQVLATASDLQLWRRRGPEDWSPLPYGLPESASGCAGAVDACGRRPAATELTPIATAPGGEGVLFGSTRCSAIFWRRPREACAAFMPLPAEVPPGWDARGLRALAEHEGRLYAGAAEGHVYELELVSR